MFKSAGIIFIAAIFFAGCSTSKPPEKVIEPVEGKNIPSGLNWNSSKKAFAPAPQESVAPTVKSNPRIVSALNTWIPLAQWAAQHQLKAPRQVASAPEAAYSIESSHGTMILGIGSREVTWNGTEINLGFAPQIIDGEICLYGVDLQKNLEPLLCELPISFPKTNRVIVIDPGHGGSNTGTHSVLDGRFEKEFTLDTALRLKPLLESNGWTVFLTHTNDADFSLADRVAFAEAHHADLFISLHFNATANPDPKIGGIETYCTTPTGLPSTLTRGFPDPWSENLPNNAFDAQNLKLAVLAQSALVHATGLEDRGVCRARFIGVLRGQKRPAILIEAGYLSNPHEAKLIESADYRQKLAETLAAALK